MAGPGSGGTWEITGEGSGTLNGQVHFAGVENLSGAADNEDTFIFEPDGSLSGMVDGGEGGFDTLQLDGGSYETIVLTPTGPDSGSIMLDTTSITYAGLEPPRAVS